MRRLTAFILALAFSGLAIGDVSDAQTLPQLSVGDSAIVESAGSYCTTVSRTGSTAKASSFTYSTVADTATPGTDYVGASGTQTIRKGTSKITFCKPLLDDKVFENDERFFVDIKVTSNGVAVKPRGVHTIRDDDPKPVEPPPPVQCPDGSTVPAGSMCPAPPPADGWIAYPLTEPYHGLHKAAYARALKACGPVRADWGPVLVAGNVYRIVGVGVAQWSDGIYRDHWGVVAEGAGPTTATNQTTVLTECLVGLHKGTVQLPWTSP